MAVLDTLMGGTEQRSYIAPFQEPQLRRIAEEAGRIYGEQAPPTYQAEYSRFLPEVTRQLMENISGAYMPGGTAFEEQMMNIGKAIQPQIASQFGTAGRYGSGLHKAAVAEELGKAGTNLYQQERGRQLGLLRDLPSILGQTYGGYYQAPYAALMPYKQAVGAPITLQEQKQRKGLESLVGFNIGP